MIVFRLLFLSILLFLTACAAPQTKQLIDHAPQTLAKRQHLIDVPFTAQKKFFCGPATLNMAMQHKGKLIEQHAIAQQIFTPNKKGTFQVDMTSYAREQGFVVYPVTPSLNGLLHEVAEDNPVIVLQNLGFSWIPRWHYALVVGYNVDERTITLHSGTNAHYTIGLSTFERTWKRSQHWGFILLDGGELPAENAPEKLTDAVIESDLSGYKDKAKQSYIRITEEWPTQHLAWFALGNRHYSDGELTQSIAAFSQATKLATQDNYFNNLGYTVAEYGCLDFANAVIECGLSHFPQSTLLQKTQREIQHFTKNALSCPKYECISPK